MRGPGTGQESRAWVGAYAEGVTELCAERHVVEAGGLDRQGIPELREQSGIGVPLPQPA